MNKNIGLMNTNIENQALPVNDHFVENPINNNYVPNSSSIPNIFFDYWMPKLSPAEFKVLMCVARKTYGWHKDFDLISLKQIEKMTGLNKSGIVKNVSNLVQRGILTKLKSKTSDGDDAPNRYGINVSFGGEVVYSVDRGGSLLSRQGVVYSVDTQKKESTKEKKISFLSEQSSDERDNIFKSFPEEAKECANIILEKVTSFHPKIKKPDMNKWEECIDLLNRKDGRSYDEIKEFIEWIFNDCFWSAVVQSPQNLRKNWDKIAIKKSPPMNKGRVFETNKKLAYEALEALRSCDRVKEIRIMDDRIICVPKNESILLNLSTVTFKELVIKHFALKES